MNQISHITHKPYYTDEFQAHSNYVVFLKINVVNAARENVQYAL